MTQQILLKNAERGGLDIRAYRKSDGYQALEKVLRQYKPLDVIDEIKRSGLRGRGGAGFPTGKKWEMVATHREAERYLVCNAGEHEPGTYKDRRLLRLNPHQLLEGVAIGTYAVGAKETHIFINGAFTDEIALIRQAVEDARKEGFLGQNILGTGFSCDVQIFLGPDTYVAGEETAMLEAMQGRDAKPKHKPPFYPTVYGLYGKPTVVNNVETLSNVPHILFHGADWFRSIGTKTCPGTMLFSIGGDINRPGVYELPLGIPVRRLIEDYGGGIKNGRRLKVVYPGGPSHAFLTLKDIDVPMDFDSLKAIGSGLGSAGVIVLDETNCMVEQTMEFCNFFREESCGQCPPCKMGTRYLHQLLEKIEAGHGKMEDLQSLQQLSGFVKGRGDCTVITGAAVAVECSLRHFPDEFESHIKEHRCTVKVAS
ncbi:MAG: NADH-quinone oxidoreductase subunit NuoF [Nitrospirae bacterium]|nr:NADH-quinone oxidoreductase subunit NuoF [Nitrospirota bacterium]